jgi:DNA-binding FadR family transcriptional regulator
LPSLGRLAEELQIAVDRLEEALLLPQAQDFLMVEHGPVTKVRVRPAAPRPLGPVNVLDAADQEQLQQELPRLLALLWARSKVESATARLAATNRDMYHLQILGDTFSKMEATSWRLRRFVRIFADKREQIPYLSDSAAGAEGARAAWAYKRHDWIFHLTIAAAAGDPDLYEQVDELRHSFFASFDGRWYRWLHQQESVREHYEIMMAIHRRDEAAASAAMDGHLETSGRTLRDWLHIGKPVST